MSELDKIKFQYRQLLTNYTHVQKEFEEADAAYEDALDRRRAAKTKVETVGNEIAHYINKTLGGSTAARLKLMLICQDDPAAAGVSIKGVTGVDSPDRSDPTT